MRNFISWPFVALALTIFLGAWGPALASDGEPTPPLAVGERQYMGSVCDAEGVKAVMRVAMETGDPEAGNKEFSRQRQANPPRCQNFEERRLMTIVDMTYVGHFRRLHMWVIEFDTGVFAVLNRWMRPTTGPRRHQRPRALEV